MNAKYELAISGLINTGYAVIENFLDEELLVSLRRNLASQYDHGMMKRAGIGKWNNFQENLEIRGDFIHWIDNLSNDEVEKEFLTISNDFAQYLNSTCYAGVKSFEFHYAIYPNGSFYKRHIDQFTNDEGRMYSMIFYLNENWGELDGGELVLHLLGETVSILPKGGTLVFFESEKIEHEVLPSKKERMSITGWLKNTETLIPQ